MLLVANLANTKQCKNLRNHWNPGIWVLIWKYSARAFQWIPTWQGSDGFRKSLRSCVLDKSSLSIGRVYKDQRDWTLTVGSGRSESGSGKSCFQGSLLLLPPRLRRSSSCTCRSPGCPPPWQWSTTQSSYLSPAENNTYAIWRHLGT